MSLLTRLTEGTDASHLATWLADPEVLSWFPMTGDREINDAVRVWMSFAEQGASLTALWDDKPCGIATLNIFPFQKLSHQCLFSIIVGKSYRGQGVGTTLIRNLIELGKEKFHLEIIHLEVYEGNPAIALYRRMGFEEYGRHPRFIKEGPGNYADKILMQRRVQSGRT